MNDDPIEILDGMHSKNMTFTVVQNRSNLPTIFTMSNPQSTAEKSVQTHESPNTSLINSQPENAATEVANTLVSMAAGQQRATSIPNVKHVNVITVPNTSTSLPVLSLADYTTSRGVPTAIALATQANLAVRNLDENAMSTDEMTDGSNQSTSTPPVKSRRTTKSKHFASKTAKTAPVEPIQYGPITVKPRKHVAPTLANGRRSKDEPLPPDEEMKRKQRRDRNKDAAAKCRRKRNELREQLEKTEQILLDQQKALETSVQTLAEQKHQLEHLLHRHPCARKSSLPITTLNNGKIDLKGLPTANTFVDASNNPINTKRVTINFSNPQDLLAVAAPLARSNSIGETVVSTSSSNVPMITIHIVPEMAQAILGSASVDRAKLVELLQQATTTTTSNTPNGPTNSTTS